MRNASMGYLIAECKNRWYFDGSVRHMSVTIGCVAAMTAVGLGAESFGVVQAWYGSPHVALVAVVTNRYGLRCGLVATMLSAPAWNFFFAAAPKYHFGAPTRSEITIYLSMLAVACLIAPRARPRVDPPRVLDTSASLPFTADPKDKGGMHGTGRRFWEVASSGDWADDCAVGGQYARIYLNRIRYREPAPLLGWVIGDMIARGRYTGMEAGFAQGIAEAVLRSSQAAPGAEPPRQSPG